MEKSPCRGCVHEFDPKDECIRTCNKIGKLQKLSHRILTGRVRSDYIPNTSHAVSFGS